MGQRCLLASSSELTWVLCKLTVLRHQMAFRLSPLPQRLWKDRYKDRTPQRHFTSCLFTRSTQCPLMRLNSGNLDTSERWYLEHIELFGGAATEWHVQV